MKKIEIETKWYEYEDQYLIMITKENNLFEATIFKKEYGTGISMFAIQAKTWEQIEEIVEETAEEYTNILEWTIQTIEEADQ